jgi:hypothetical protein
MPPPSDSAAWTARCCSQLLTDPVVTDPVEVVRHLLAVQAQDSRAMRLAIRSRTTGVIAADVDQALTEDRSLVVTWLNRGTLHLVTAEDYWWLHALTTPRFETWHRTRLAQEGVSPADDARGVDLIAQAVAEGPRTRAQLREVLDDGGVPTAGQALVHVLTSASIAGAVVRGPVVGNQLAYVSTAGWLGPPPPPLSTDEALARLADRYLVGHSPADPADLAKWSGITVTAARQAFAHLHPTRLSPAEPHHGDTPRWPTPRLLGGFDPLLHGWVDRTGITGDHRGIVTVNGLFRPIALVDGRAVATWGLAGKKLTINPLEIIDPSTLELLHADADGVTHYLGVG